MTTKDERLHSLIYARNFMLSLLDPKATPKVPRAIRREAYYRLKHYPCEYEIRQIPKHAGKWFAERFEVNELKSDNRWGR